LPGQTNTRSQPFEALIAPWIVLKLALSHALGPSPFLLSSSTQRVVTVTALAGAAMVPSNTRLETSASARRARRE
jgi:hypothetical protein